MLFRILGVRWEAVGFYRKIKNVIDYTSFDATTSQDVYGNLPGSVDVKGAQLVLSAIISDELSGSASFSISESVNSVSGKQIDNIPTRLGKLLLDYHPQNSRFGFTASVNYVGPLNDTALGATQSIGNYAVIDLGGRVFMGDARHHR